MSPRRRRRAQSVVHWARAGKVSGQRRRLTSGKEMNEMTGRWSRLAVATTMLSITIPGVVALAEAQVQAGPENRSPELRARLHDGRLAMIRESLKLNEAQQKLWAPVEAQLRASFEARQKLRAEWRALRERDGADRPSLSDRLDRRSQRLTERAEQ